MVERVYIFLSKEIQLTQLVQCCKRVMHGPIYFYYLDRNHKYQIKTKENLFNHQLCPREMKPQKSSTITLLNCKHNERKRLQKEMISSIKTIRVIDSLISYLLIKQFS